MLWQRALWWRTVLVRSALMMENCAGATCGNIGNYYGVKCVMILAVMVLLAVMVR